MALCAALDQWRRGGDDASEDLSDEGQGLDTVFE
jgi:hypothetical protein